MGLGTGGVEWVEWNGWSGMGREVRGGWSGKGDEGKGGEGMKRSLKTREKSAVAVIIILRLADDFDWVISVGVSEFLELVGGGWGRESV